MDPAAHAVLFIADINNLQFYNSLYAIVTALQNGHLKQP